MNAAAFSSFVLFAKIAAKIVASQLDPNSQAGVLVNKLLEVANAFSNLAALPTGAGASPVNAFHGLPPQHEWNEESLSAWADRQLAG